MEKEKSMSNIKNLCIGGGISLVLSVIFLLAFSFLLVNTDLKETTVGPVVILLSSICILIGSIFCARKNGKKGILNGGIVGGVYLLILWIISSMFIDGMGFTIETAIMLLSCILTGMLGGIIGVNFAKTK